MSIIGFRRTRISWLRSEIGLFWTLIWLFLLKI